MLDQYSVSENGYFFTDVSAPTVADTSYGDLSPPVAIRFTVQEPGVTTFDTDVIDDWYLPSTVELVQMCKWVRGVAWISDATSCADGESNSGQGASGFGDVYWSSSETALNTARFQNFFTPQQGNVAKSYGARIRPIRAF